MSNRSKYRDSRITIEIHELAHEDSTKSKVLDMSVGNLVTMTALATRGTEDALCLTPRKGTGFQVTVRFNGIAILKIIP